MARWKPLASSTRRPNRCSAECAAPAQILVQPRPVLVIRGASPADHEKLEVLLLDVGDHNVVRATARALDDGLASVVPFENFVDPLTRHAENISNFRVRRRGLL